MMIFNLFLDCECAPIVIGNARYISVFLRRSRIAPFVRITTGEYEDGGRMINLMNKSSKKYQHRLKYSIVLSPFLISFLILYYHYT